MKATCPSCGFGGGIEAFIADAEWREAVLASAALPSDCGVLAARYVGMFRPAKRALSPSRAARLFSEINDMIINGVEFDRQTIKAPSHVWAVAIQAVLDSPTLRRPLKDHHYLLRIVQTKLSQKTDRIQNERSTARRAETWVNSNGMQPMNAAARMNHPGPPHPGSVANPDPLHALSDDDRERWLKMAREALKADGFKEQFMAGELIKQKARELMEVTHAGN